MFGSIESIFKKPFGLKIFKPCAIMAIYFIIGHYAFDKGNLF